MKIEELVKQKELKITTNEERQKVDLIKDILEEDDWMFKNSMEVVIGMLEFLDVPEDKIKEYYISLISVENYQTRHPKERI